MLDQARFGHSHWPRFEHGRQDGAAGRLAVDMNPEDRDALARLGRHWGEHYAVTMSDDCWSAVPYGRPAEMLTADSPAELSERLRTDFAGQHPVVSGLPERMST
jgi:hypothetical protein